MFGNFVWILSYISQKFKVFDFNRYYLLFSLLFSTVVPLITIHVNLNLPVNSNILGVSDFTETFMQGKEANTVPIQFLTFQNSLIILYLIVSTILLIRFTLNIYKIIRLIGKSTILNNFDTQIVLVEHKILPYSFFRYIFVNRLDYENGKIDKQLIIHEQTHCSQNHSVDIIIIELVKIVLWFNPLLWLFRKAIQLNHEFLADKKVLSTYDLSEYQNTLINLVFRNNSTYLASNFDYSLTKKRLIMMTKNDSLQRAVFLKIAAIPLFLILVVTLTFSQENIPKGNLMNYQNEWWYPILIKHKIEPGAFNNFENIFETGTKNSINNRVVTIENAIFIIKSKTNDYTILKSPLAFHDLEMKSISGAEGTYKTYNFKSRKLKTSGTLKDFKYTFKEDGKTSLASKEWENKSK